MRCPSCGFENPEGKKFCEECGARLVWACPSCGSEVRPTAKFCGECGHPLMGQPPASPPTQRDEQIAQTAPVQPRSTLRSTPEAERRQLTVMFCDLVDSTALSTRLDPEDLREVVRAYQQTSTAIIDHYEGHIAQHLGDGLLVYFGYPVAHEDDAQRAVRAALSIVEALQKLSFPAMQVPRPVQVRIGIHTGLVVVGEIGSGEKREVLALGETPNLAARLQAMAEPDTVVISAATAYLIRGYFTCQELGPSRLKGLAQPLAVYRVLHESGLRTRLQVARMTGLTPLVGRDQELALLLQRWEQAKEGAGQVVLVNGEAGIGKSRLLHVLAERVAREPHARLDFRCSPYHQHSALYPVIDLLQRALQFRREDSPQARLAKLETTFARYGLTQADTLAFFAALLSLPAPHLSSLALTPQQQRQKTLEAAVAVLRAVARHQPLLLLAEDLHWVDPSTLELFSLLLMQIPTARILAVFTARPEFVPPWPPRSHLTALTLPRLPRRHVEEMAEKVARDKALPAEVLQQVTSRTDGIPLFVEEFTKMVLESGLLTEREGRYELTSSLSPLAIPVTLHDSLMARLDRLSTVKEVAQLGATLGREFSYELIRAISPLDDAILQRELARLVEAELLYQTGLPPRATYLFKHALIREVAYQSLLKGTRQRYHQQIAQVLEERFSEVKETQPELLAHHYTEAGLMTQALPYWQRAGEKAAQRSAYLEAIDHLTRGLGLLKTLPETPEHAQQEVMLQITLGRSLTATNWAAPRVRQAYSRAWELCRQAGKTPQLGPVLWGLWAFYIVRAEHQTAHELGEQLFDLAQNVQDPTLARGAQQALGAALYCMGELTRAREHLEQGIALYKRQQPGVPALVYGSDPVVFSLLWAAHAIWLLGYPDQALKRSHEALALVQELSHPFSLVLAQDYAATLHQFRQEERTAQERAAAAIALCTEQGFAYYLAWGTIMRGWALAKQGQGEEGIAQMRQGLAAMQAAGAELRQPYYLALLAEVYGEGGQTAEGLRMLEEALTIVDKTGERYYEAELYRLRGELTLQSKAEGTKAKVGEVKECFWKAISIARQQQAKALELRAVMSLARLWQQQGKREEARQLLAEIYNWFTEGFDTTDLQEARALLEDLS